MNFGPTSLRLVASRARAAGLLAAAFFALQGCQPPSADSTSATLPLGDVASVAVDSVNYRHDRAVAYTLFDLSQNPPRAIGGEVANRLASGGSKGCCLALPKAWRSGLKVRVQWTESDLERTYPEQYARDLEIPRYEQPADLYVVFYPGHDVEVVVSAGEPGHSQWAGRVKSTPWDHCVAANGRKPCKSALPKVFSIEESRGFCSFVKEHNPSELDQLCGASMFLCIKDYEDEELCKKALWSPARKDK